MADSRERRVECAQHERRYTKPRSDEPVETGRRLRRSDGLTNELIERATPSIVQDVLISNTFHEEFCFMAAGVDYHSSFFSGQLSTG